MYDKWMKNIDISITKEDIKEYEEDKRQRIVK